MNIFTSILVFITGLFIGHLFGKYRMKKYMQSPEYCREVLQRMDFNKPLAYDIPLGSLGKNIGPLGQNLAHTEIHVCVIRRG
jgi:hypothetical protein